MTELRLGKVTNKELAVWFNTTDTQISRKKNIFLKKLEEYCQFKPVWGGVEIIEIYRSIYIKNKNYNIVKNNFDTAWSKNKLDSCKRVAGQIYQENKEQLTIKESTVYQYTKEVRNELYGRPMCYHGVKGSCTYIWCKKDDTGHLAFLSEKEEKIKKELLNKYFSTADEKVVIVKNMVDKGEIKKEEAWITLDELLNLDHSYSSFMYEFKAKTGIQLIRGTLLEDGLIFIDEDKSEE